MALSIGEALLTLGAKTDKLDADLAGAEQKSVGWVKKVGGTLTTMLGAGVIAGAGLAAGAIATVAYASFDLANQTQTATQHIQTQYGLTATEAQRLGDIAQDVWANNFGADVEDAAQTIALLRQQLGDMSDQELQAAAENALRLRDNYEEMGYDSGKGIQAAKTLMEQFGLSSEEAFGFIARGYQEGMDANGDFLDSITEYGTQFSSAGADASQFFNLMQSGMAEGVLGTDKAADAFKEFRVRILDGSELTRQSLTQLGLDADTMLSGLQDGTLSSAEAFDEVLTALQNTDDQALLMQAGVGLLGTQFEDLGQNIINGMSLGEQGALNFTDSLEGLDERYNTLGDAAEGFKRRAIKAFAPVGEAILNVVNKAMPYVNTLFTNLEQTIGPIVENIGNKIGGIVDAFFAGIEEGGIMQGIQDALAQFLPPETVEKVTKFIEAMKQGWNWIKSEGIPTIKNLVTTVWGTLKPGLETIATVAMKLAQTVFPILGGIVKWVGENFEWLAPIIGGIAAVIALLSSPISLLVVALVGLATAWGNNWGGIQEKVMSVYAALKPKIDQIAALVTRVAAAVSAWWTEHGDEVVTFVKGVIGLITDFAQSTVEQWGRIVGFFVSIISGDWAGAWENLSGYIETAFTMIGDLLGGLWELVSPYLIAFAQSIVDWFNSQDWAAIGQKLLDDLLAGLQFIGEKALEFLGILWTSVTTWFQEQDWAAHGRAVADFIRDGLVTLWEKALAWLGEVWTNITTWFSEQDWKAIGSGAVTFLLDGLYTLWENAILWLTEVWTNITAWFSEQDWKSIGFNAMTVLLEGLYTLWERATTWLSETWTNITTWFAEKDWKQIGIDSAEKLKNGLAELWDKISTVLSTLWTSFTTWFSDKDWGSVATNIIDGLVTGITDGMAAIAQAMTDLAGGALDAWNSFWDSHSPSRKMEREAANVTAGAVKGLSTFQQEIKAAMTPDDQPAFGGAGSTSSVTNNWNLTVSTPMKGVEQEYEFLRAAATA